MGSPPATLLLRDREVLETLTLRIRLLSLPIFTHASVEPPPDGPLPIELRRRVMGFLHTMDEHGRKAWNQRVEQASSMNAVIREKVSRGEI